MPERRTEDLLWHSSPLIEISRYAVALTVVVGLGSAATLAVLRYQADGQVTSDVDEAVLLDLPPVIESSAPQRDVTEGPEQQALQAAAPIAPAPPTEIKSDPPTPTPPDPKPEQPQDPTDQKIDVLSARKPEAAVIPPPKPPDTARLEKPPEDRKPDPVKTEAASPPPPPVAAAPSQETGVSGSGAPAKEAVSSDSEAAPARATKAISQWQRSMIVRLQAAKNGMRTGGEFGSVEVGFSIDHTGAIAASRVTRSSGSRRLDQAALALVQRASPFPEPPAGLTTRELTFKIPIVFARRK